MAIVSDIQLSRGLVTIDVDGLRLCRVKRKFYEKMPLQLDDVLDPERYIDQLSQLMLGEAYEQALTLLDYSARASGELKKRLLQKGYLEPAVAAVLERMRENRLIDDSAYAERMVESAKGKPVGRYQLQRKLRAKGVSEEAAEQALSSIVEEEQTHAARALAQKLLPKYQDQPARARRAKLSQALARRGFSWDTISEALDGLGNDDDWDA